MKNVISGLPSPFQSHAAQGIHPGIPVAQYEVGSMRNFCYFFMDWEERKAALVDPQKDWQPLIQDLSHHQIELEAVLLTHTHFDHVAGVSGLVAEFPHLKIWVHPLDADRLKKTHPHLSLSYLQDGMTFSVGKLPIEVIHTPGHSAGECCFFLGATQTQPPYLLTGDTLFIRDCGRTDLPTGNDAELWHSLQKVKKLPPTTVILPGHHYAPEVASTLEVECKVSPPLLCQSVEELRALP